MPVLELLDKSAADRFGISRSPQEVELLDITIAVLAGREQEMPGQQCAALLEKFQ